MAGLKARVLPGWAGLQIVFALVLLVAPRTLASTSSQTTIVSSSGVIDYPRIEVTVNASTTIGLNNLSLGFMLDGDWKAWLRDSALRECASNASFKIVRLFDWKWSDLRPCISWNESTMSGAFNWSNIDLLVQGIFGIGAEPLFCLGAFSDFSTGERAFCAPPGMSINPGTSLPYPASWAAYCAEWVKHFKSTGVPARFYEIVNEPYFYFGWVDYVKLDNYVKLWNAAARKMREVNSNVMLSHDAIMFDQVMDYWTKYGDSVDFLAFHKYDCYATDGSEYLDNAAMLARAESRYFDFVDRARLKWFNSRGKLLPVINSESGFNSAFQNGTDPRTTQMISAVWTALVLRMGVLKGLSDNIYYTFSSPASICQNSATGGYGFGMVNSDDDKPWYPYYVQWMLGNNMQVGDPIVYSNSSSNDLRSLAWIHNKTMNVLLIYKIEQESKITLQGLQGAVNFQRIDETISWRTPDLQTGIIDSKATLSMSGYTVALLQASVQT